MIGIRGMQHAVWLASRGTASTGADANRNGRGRAGGLFEREGCDKQDWNSDDEEVDEFGRKKKRRTGNRSAKPSGSGDAYANDRKEAAQSEEALVRAQSRPAPGPAASSAAMSPAYAPSTANEASAMQVLMQKMSNHEAMQEPLKKTARPSQSLLVTERQERGKQWVPPKPLSGKPVPCKYYAQGSCSWGNRCKNIHDPMDQLKSMQGFIDFATGLPKDVAKPKPPPSYPTESNEKYDVSAAGTVRLKPGSSAGGVTSPNSLVDSANSQEGAKPNPAFPKETNDKYDVSPGGTVRLKAMHHHNNTGSSSGGATGYSGDGGVGVASLFTTPVTNAAAPANIWSGGMLAFNDPLAQVAMMTNAWNNMAMASQQHMASPAGVSDAAVSNLPLAFRKRLNRAQ